MPAMHLISVDLPAPLSPTSAMTSPFLTSKSTSESACTEPYDFETSRSWRRGVSSLTEPCSYQKLPVEAPTSDASTSRVLLLAVLRVLADAHVASLQELVLEEAGVVR